MKLSDYIQGSRKGKEAHRLEKEAMGDPFLADAMDGYNGTIGNHERKIEELRRQVMLKSKGKRNYTAVWSIAASLLIGVCMSGYFLFQKDSVGKPSREIAWESEKPDVPPAVPKDEIMESVTQVDTPASASVSDRMEASNSTKMELSEDYELDVIASVTPDPIHEVDEKAMDADSHFIQEEDTLSLEEVVVVGYSIKKQNRLTGSVKVSRSLGKPQPVIGMKAFKKYLKKNMVRPEKEEDCVRVKGKVILTFQVGENGRPDSITVKKGLCPSVDEEAIRLINDGPDWTAGNEAAEITIRF